MAGERTSGLSMMKPRAEKPAKESAKEEGAKKQYLTPPEGYSPPDDSEAGDTFDATVRFKIEDDGRYCIVTIDGVPFDEEEKIEEPEPPTMAEAAAAHREGGYMM